MADGYTGRRCRTGACRPWKAPGISRAARSDRLGLCRAIRHRLYPHRLSSGSSDDIGIGKCLTYLPQRPGARAEGAPQHVTAPLPGAASRLLRDADSLARLRSHLHGGEACVELHLNRGLLISLVRYLFAGELLLEANPRYL